MKLEKLEFDLKGIRQIFSEPAVDAANRNVANAVCDTANSIGMEYASSEWPGRKIKTPLYEVTAHTTNYGTTAYNVGATGYEGNYLQAKYSVLTKAMASHGVEIAYTKEI